MTTESVAAETGVRAEEKSGDNKGAGDKEEHDEKLASELDCMVESASSSMQARSGSG